MILEKFLNPLGSLFSSDVHFRNITLADGKEGGLGGKKLETETKQKRG